MYISHNASFKRSFLFHFYCCELVCNLFWHRNTINVFQFIGELNRNEHAFSLIIATAILHLVFNVTVFPLLVNKFVQREQMLWWHFKLIKQSNPASSSDMNWLPPLNLTAMKDLSLCYLAVGVWTKTKTVCDRGCQYSTLSLSTQLTQHICACPHKLYLKIFFLTVYVSHTP